MNALVTGGEVDEQTAGAAHAFALEDRDAGWDVHQGEGAQISAEGGGRGSGGGVFDHVTGRERVAGVKDSRAFAHTKCTVVQPFLAISLPRAG